MSAPAANSASTTSGHRFPWKWSLSDLQKVKRNGLKVFSCFACGGGSSMGYKLAGFDVVGNCEIDPKIAAIYKRNLHPRHSYVMDVRDFLKLPDEKIAPELFDLDVLDGSPPCSTFSMAGDREKAWNKEKQFAEGQKLQRLDDLFFTFIAIAKRLRPKIVVAENVKGLLLGNAKGYVREIARDFEEAGYDVQLFLLNSAYMGVPQIRERSVFVARRKDLNLPKLHLSFNEKPILFKEVKSERGNADVPASLTKALRFIKKGDTLASQAYFRGFGKKMFFTTGVVWDDSICNTIIAGSYTIRGNDKTLVSREDMINASTFPQDYEVDEKRTRFICGMSVPPVMMAQVASQIAEQWFGIK